MSAYYNEFDPFAAEWLRELIKDGLIADGVVDERSIEDVDPKDIKEFTQCHFFAGIGGWSYAARLANWPDDRPMWTGSPPCQPFSVAGNKKGKDDLRHLWPVFFNLIRECQPPVVFGEQVASAIRMGWFDDLQADMENEGYATGMVVLPANFVGAPHKRDRLFYVADRVDNTNTRRHNSKEKEICTGRQFIELSELANSGMADTGSEGFQGSEWSRASGEERTPDGHSTECSESEWMANTNDSRQSRPWELRRSGNSAQTDDRKIDKVVDASRVNHWRESTTVFCRDGKHRQIPTEPALFPLANGIPNRVGTLRGAGNAIVLQVGAEVIRAFMEK